VRYQNPVTVSPLTDTQRDGGGPFASAAKCVPSLDQLSGGRFFLGITGGWNIEEMENHGVRSETRFKLMRAHILAMKALWTQEQAAFHD
jgi:alkanesulfonate monooxygenase SsuD/methylene tetrahydromethanopterin reductase-like flavin-dependent oxidoreductase (luciferase family)